MKKVARSIYLDIFGAFAKPAKGVHFLNGHYIFKNASISKKRQISVFDSLIKGLSNEVQFISAGEAIALDRDSSQEASYCCITVDDGFHDCYEYIAPVLDQYGIKGTFFINPQYLDLDKESAINIQQKYYNLSSYRPFLSKGQVKELVQNGHIIGSHTMCHKRLVGLDNKALQREISESKDWIESITQEPCNYFAFPYGGNSDIDKPALDLALKTYPHVFSSTSSSSRFEFGGEVINRRHFEGNWPVNHVKYFLSKR